MKRLWILLLLILIPITVYAQSFNGGFVDFNSNFANSIFVDNSDWDGFLAASTVTTVQIALDTLDNITASDIPIIDTGTFYDSEEVEGALQEIGRVVMGSSCESTGYSFYNDADGNTGYWCMNGVELASVKLTPTFDNRVVTNGDNRVTTNGDSRRVR